MKKNWLIISLIIISLLFIVSVSMAQENGVPNDNNDVNNQVEEQVEGKVEQKSGNFDFNALLFGKKLAFGAFLGFLIGFAIKKSIKIGLFVAGILLIFLVFLSEYNIIIINWDYLKELYQNFVKGISFKSGYLSQTLNWFKSSIPTTGGFAVGFFSGLKIG